MVDLVIFDCDGVLINSETVYLAVELGLLEELGVGFERSDYVRQMQGLSERDWWVKIAAAVLDQTGSALPDGVELELNRRYMEGLERLLAPLPGASSTIGQLSTARCVASSSGMQRLEWKLQRTGLYDLFAPNVFSADLVEHGKPAPDLFFLAASTFGVHPDRCLVVEDSANGVQAGKAAGMQVVGLTAGDHCVDDHNTMLRDAGADWIATSFQDIGPIVDELSRG